jgi:hypothetical protein
MMDSLTRLFEGNNINRRVTLRTDLKNMRMHNSETIHSYFSRVNQIKEQIESIGDTVNIEEMVMTTLNDLPSSWDAFIQGIYSIRNLPKFGRLWKDCNQEEARMEEREAKMTCDDDQALAAHTRKGKRKKEPSSPKKFRKGEEITQILDVSIVRKYDTLLGIFPQYFARNVSTKLWSTNNDTVKQILKHNFITPI